MLIQLINHLDSKLDKEVGIITNVMQQYVDIVSEAHGKLSSFVGFTPGMQLAPQGTCPVGIFESPDQPGALGYHDTDPAGRAYGKIFHSLIPKGEMLHDATDKGQSVAAVTAHEIAEMIGDEPANMWAQLEVSDPDTSDIYNLLALELCDPVQENVFTLKTADGTIVDCADFVFPKYFNPKAGPNERLSYMDMIHQPGTVAPGGYQIVAREAGDTQVFGVRSRQIIMPTPKRIFHPTAKPALWREEMRKEIAKANLHSRTHKRLALGTQH